MSTPENLSATASRLPPPVHPQSQRRELLPPRPGLHSAPTPPPPPPPPPRPGQMHSSQRAVPPLLPKRPATPSTVAMPGSVEPLQVDDSDSLHEEHILQPSDARLRELYEEEEIDRFLRLFSTYVREVRAPASPSMSRVTSQSDPTGSPSKQSSVAGEDADVQDEDDDEWFNPQKPVSTDPKASPRPTPLSANASLSEWAASYIAARLPTEHPSPRFTIGRLRLTVDRLYLAFVTAYFAVFAEVVRLASWQQHGRSICYCLLYWVLWYHDLLLAGLLLRILYSLVRRKFLPYPSLKDLQERRRVVHGAEHFSRNVVTGVVSAGSVRIGDFLKTFKKSKSAPQKPADEKNRDEDSGSAFAGYVPDVVVDNVSVDENSVEATDEVTPEEAEVVRTILRLANAIADLQERIKNIFLWRRPQVSALYGVLLTVLFFVSLMPAYYMAKLAGFVIGVLFWHVTPVLVALPAGGLYRLPAPLSNAPTDAEYAMQLMSERVENGLDVVPKRRQGRGAAGLTSSNATPNASTSSLGVPNSAPAAAWSDKSVDWTKWGGRVAATKNKISDGTWKQPSTWSRSSTPRTDGQAPQRQNTHSFPAHCHSPGLITITDDTLLFTPFSSLRPSVTIDLKRIVGVKRTRGVTRGVRVRWTEGPDEEEKEAKFSWVGGLDELFARLVGWQGRRWLAI